ncbi:MAG: hypothetical protein LDL44_00520 [Caenispirillum sp.]|nr:hypothetical protein [Caenispirillum sp.]
MDVVNIMYRFQLGETRVDIPLRFDPVSYDLVPGDGATVADWTRLDHHQCTNCPLVPQSQRQCPFAAALAQVIPAFDGLPSIAEVEVEVVTEQRSISAATTLQRGMASVIGLVSAASGCPHTRFFRPMARFHLPFATMEETLFRAFSTHLLGEYFRSGGTSVADVGFERIRAFYAEAEKVNRGMAERLGSVAMSDAALNAIIILNSFAEVVPYFVEERLSELEHLFH